MTGAASLIKALTVARVPADEIAEKLRTSRKNIAVFQKIYFDIQRYLDEQAWLSSIIFAPSQNPQDAVEFRERHLMAAAFVRGERGLGQAFTPKVALLPKEREELTSQIKSVLTSRAFEFVSALGTGLIPPSSEDFERFTKMLDVAARQPPEDDKDYRPSFFALLDAAEKAGQRPENANNEVLQLVVSTRRECRERALAKRREPQKVLTW